MYRSTRICQLLGRRGTKLLIEEPSVVWFSSTATRAADALPSNLTFDRKSSFSPHQGTPVLPLDDKAAEEDANDALPDENYDTRELLSKSQEETKFAIPLPDRLNAPIHHVADGSISGTLPLDPSVFGVDPVRLDLIKQSVDYIRNKIRGRRKAKTKTIGEVSGSGRKVRQQKGTGRARAGHSRPAHWRGGAKAHGPKNTVDYGNVKMNKKARRKTSPWASFLSSNFGVGKEGSSALILDCYNESEDDEEEEHEAASFNGVPVNLWVASGNVAKVKVANHTYANVYEILRREKLIVTLSALSHLESRWKD